MSFIAIDKNIITDNKNDFRNDKMKIFFSPLPKLEEAEFPTVWLDLHISGEWYEVCGKDSKRKFKKIDEEFYVSIPPNRSYRFILSETIGIANDITGLIVNTSSMAVRGLSVAPGKIDPGFRPNKINVVVVNHSKRPLDIKAGDKIATIAFAKTDQRCVPVDSCGWGNRKIENYSKSLYKRILIKINNTDYFELVKTLIMGAIGAAVFLFIKFLYDKYGINKP